MTALHPDKFGRIGSHHDEPCDKHEDKKHRWVESLDSRDPPDLELDCACGAFIVCDTISHRHYYTTYAAVRNMQQECGNDDVSEVTLAGNGVNSSEAGLTLRWVMELLEGKRDS